MFGSKAPVGVDIGTHTIKVCQLKRAGEGYELERFGAVEIFPGGDRPMDAQEQQAAKINALKQALAVGGIKAKHSVSAVSGESIIVRYLQLPEMPEDELKKALQWEAEEYIPFRLSEVNLDSVILGRGSDGEHPKMDVLLVSAKKDLVESHLSVIRGAGLEPRIVDVDSFAFLNCFEINHQPALDECVALINIGAEITGINIYSGGVSRFSRDIPVGGNTITAAVKARLGCSISDAEGLKINIGVAPVAAAAPKAESNVQGSLMDSIRGTVEEMTGAHVNDHLPEVNASKAINGVVAGMLLEVRRSLEFFESQYRGINVSRVVLGGGTAVLRNLAQQFEQELRLPVEMIDPLRRIKVSSRGNLGEQVLAVRHQLGVGIGLGIRGMAA
jgi:type IV pilus assembly protein PilM